MNNIIIWHNPRCSKSRQALALLEQAGAAPVVLKYLELPPTVKELQATLSKLQISAPQLVRRGEAVFKSLGLSEDAPTEVWLAAMVEHPILIERPIIICDNRAVIGRPPENALTLLE
ncbi:arsenate reductase (glutaredoxin) [Luminiphilus sp. nBUS_07]|uniref:arsenate reductase (glutaredoxin) n=1 Tax=Luminiphilus sp. nBUS_07 TaxID=3395314 RepID=UPI003EB7DA7E